MAEVGTKPIFYRGAYLNRGKKRTIKGAIKIVPFGIIDPLILSVIAGHLQTLFSLDADITRRWDDPEFAFIPARRQYDAAKILGRLSLNASGSFQLGVIAQDLCTPILTYVYGESQLGGKAAVISLNRLRHENLETLYIRAAKISLHEVGHLFGISHCWQHFCLMHFSSDMEMLDSLSLQFCSACEYEIGRRRSLLPL